jgi:hypothetical protein
LEIGKYRVGRRPRRNLTHYDHSSLELAAVRNTAFWDNVVSWAQPEGRNGTATPIRSFVEHLTGMKLVSDLEFGRWIIELQP